MPLAVTRFVLISTRERKVAQCITFGLSHGGVACMLRDEWLRSHISRVRFSAYPCTPNDLQHPPGG